LDLSAETSIKQIKVILNRLAYLANKYNTRIFIVGGPVRDMIMAKKKLLIIGQDLDIAVENNFPEIGDSLAKELDAKIIRYPQFMTMTLGLKDSSHIDIAQTREEIYYKPAVLPRVLPALIDIDLKRRDFTINAIAMEIKSKPPYPIIDPFNGQKDLEEKKIRVLHQQSFVDDPTRIFRAIRFAIRLGFKIEPKTEALMKFAIKRGYLKLLSGERILYELKLIMNEKKSIDILKSLQSYNIISNLFCVKLIKKFFIEQKNLPNGNLKLIHLISVIPESLWSKYPLLRDAVMSARCLKEFPKYRDKLAKAKRASEIYKILKVFNKLALEILKYTEKESIRIKIKNYLNKYSKVKIFTTGDMLKSLNIKPGPRYANIMNELLYKKLDKKIKNKNDEMDYLKILTNARNV
jgi:tRNA nucleotidyltransferase (CCA-adding enzyme)